MGGTLSNKRDMRTIGCIVLLLSVAGCSTGDNQQSRTASNGHATRPSADRDQPPSVQVSWDVSAVEPYFKIVSPPVFENAENAFVMIVEAHEDGNCVLAPSVPPGFFGFEAILYDEDDNEIHCAYDIGSASRSAWPVEAYSERTPKRICVEPPRWTAGTQIRLTIAPGLDPTTLTRVRRGKISAI